MSEIMVGYIIGVFVGWGTYALGIAIIERVKEAKKK